MSCFYLHLGRPAISPQVRYNGYVFEDLGNSAIDIITGPVLIILVIAVSAYAVVHLANKFIGRVVRRTVRQGKYRTKHDEKQREDTLTSIATTAVKVVVFAVALFMILGEVGLNIGPLLAGAGVVGVALGFGAQSMVKDFLAGVFIIAENQYRVGDVLQVNQGVAGVVEHVSLRTTVIRDLSGMVHYIPNGNIELATNMTMDFAQVDQNIGVGYDTDLTKLEKIINQVGEDMAKDEDWKELVLEPPTMLRVDDFADSAIIVKVISKTAPSRQWEVKGELLKRLKVAFDKAGITIPYPQRVVHRAEAD